MRRVATRGTLWTGGVAAALWLLASPYVLAQEHQQKAEAEHHAEMKEKAEHHPEAKPQQEAIQQTMHSMARALEERIGATEKALAELGKEQGEATPERQVKAAVLKGSLEALHAIREPVYAHMREIGGFIEQIRAGRMRPPTLEDMAENWLGNIKEKIAGLERQLADLRPAEGEPSLEQRLRIGEAEGKLEVFRHVAKQLPEHIAHMRKVLAAVAEGAPHPEMRPGDRGPADIGPDRLEQQIGRLERALRELKEHEGEPTPEMKERAKELMQQLEHHRARLKELRQHPRPQMPMMDRPMERGPMRDRPMMEGMMGPRPPREGDMGDRPLRLEVFRLEHTEAPHVAEILSRFLPKGSEVASDGRTNKVIVLTTEQGMERVERIVRELDEPGRPAARAERQRRQPREEGERRFEYEGRRPAAREGEGRRPESQRTVGRLVEKGDFVVRVQPQGSDDVLTLQLPSFLAEDGRRKVNPDLAERIAKLEKGDPVIVEWAQTEETQFVEGIAPAPQYSEKKETFIIRRPAKPAAKPDEGTKEQGEEKKREDKASEEGKKEAD